MKTKVATYGTREEAVKVLTDAGYKSFIGGSYIKGGTHPAWVRQNEDGTFYIHFNKSRG
jgi:hypothetical protein